MTLEIKNKMQRSSGEQEAEAKRHSNGGTRTGACFFVCVCFFNSLTPGKKGKEVHTEHLGIDRRTR